MSQTSYSINQAVARQGQLADVSFHDIVSGQLNSAGVIGVFGTLMVQDLANTNDFDAKPPAVATDVTNAFAMKGIVVEMQTIPSNVNSPALPPYYPNKYMAPLLKKGRIWVNSEDAVSVGVSHVYVRYSNPANGTIGGFRASAGVVGENGLAPDQNFAWVTSTVAVNQLAQLEINLP